MTSQFFAKPPRPIAWRSVPKYVWQSGHRIGIIIWQTLIPFHASPEDIPALPDPTGEVTDSQVEQCQWMFDQADARRDHLEQKAQSTFGLMVFLVPLIASLFVFVIGKGIASSKFTLALLLVSALLLILGFVSAVRAVGVKESQTLFLDAVIDKEGQLKPANTSNRARGLLYCASMNTAMNDHIAQFVKGAHVFTGAAVFALLCAAIPMSVALSTIPPSPVQTKIVGTIDVSSADLISLREDVASLKKEVEKLSIGTPTQEQFKLLEQKVQKLEVGLSKMQSSSPVDRSKKTTTQGRDGSD